MEPEPAPAPLEVEVVVEPRRFAALRREWDELLEDSEASIFCSWEWLYPWFARVGWSRELRIVAVREAAGSLIGVAPLSLVHRRVLGRTVRRLAFLGDERVGSDYLGIVARRGMETLVASQVASAIHRLADWDVLDLFDLVEGSSEEAAFAERFTDGFGVRSWQRSICPYESFGPGETFEGFLRRTSRRENYRRRRRWLQAQPGYRIEKEENPARLALPLAHLFRLHALRWAEGSDGIAGTAVEAFHRDAAILLAERGKLRLYTLKLADQALASVYGIVHAHKFAFYQSGFDPKWREQSVGMVLLGETFRDCIESGCVEYDFLRGTESYKLDWVTRQRRTVALRIFRLGGAGEWLDRVERGKAAARKLVQRVMPSGWVDEIRNRRRRLTQRRGDRRGC